jgi:hypothetical protein
MPILILFLALAVCAAPAAIAADLSRAVVSLPASPSIQEQKAAAMLVDEVERRTGLRWTMGGAPAAPGSPTVVLARGSGAAEGFRNAVAGSTVTVSGNDARGMLYGVGHLLRRLEMRRGSVSLADTYAVETAPQTRLRGHQLGYRPKTNSYDGWSVPMWEQYIRDLAVFGANAVELIPPRSDDDGDSPHFPIPPMPMMTAMSELLDQYGLDVWIWYPAMDDDYSKPETVESALREWGEVFSKLKRVDAVLVPAGDPGHTPAPILLPFLEKQAANLRKYHPKAQLWLAPQGFEAKSFAFFLKAMSPPPAWLSGIVYGPQVRIPLADLRAQLPASLPIRHYPDITHTRQSQYPVPDWDPAFAYTAGREPVNPRPLDQTTIFRVQQKHTIGFITYSEGCNDDVNKAIWSALGWNESADPLETLRDYSRYFIGPDFADDFAQGLLALERNWRGPALTNTGIGATLAQFQAMERRASPHLLANWRFQQALYRAYYDAYERSRLLHETAAEERAVEALRRAPATGSAWAMEEAAAQLDRAASAPVAADLRTRVFQLAEALFQSIRMQLSVPLYRGMSGRGTNLDSVDAPLNSRAWLKAEFARIGKLAAEPERLAAIARLAHWSDPGPGGFYDDLGNPAAQPHLVTGEGFAGDPQFFRTPVTFFDPRATGRKSWWDQSLALYDYPLTMRYTGLDTSSRYKVRVVYGAGPVRLQAGNAQVHEYLERALEPLEFDLPDDAARTGSLMLRWNRPPGAGGAGRGCQVAEVWLIKR